MHPQAAPPVDAGLPVLYSFRRCPYAMRARMALLAAGQACTLREVVLRDKPAALLAASPKGTVPVLVLQDGGVIEQSLEIMHWALQRHDPGAWLMPAVGDLRQMEDCIARCDGDFKRALDIYKYPERHPGTDAFRARAQGSDFLAKLDKRLREAPYLFGAHIALADVAIAPFVRQYAAVEPAWFAAQPWSALQSWLGTWQASPLFASAMRKFAPWHEGHPGEDFGPNA